MSGPKAADEQVCVFRMAQAYAQGPKVRLASSSFQGNGLGLAAIRHAHIRNDVDVRSMPGSVVL